MKILCIYDKSGPKYHRVLLPLYLMEGVELKVSAKLTEDQLEGIDVLFFNRIISSVSLKQLWDWREKYGFKMIVDYDDHWYLGPDHYLYDIYHQYQVSELMEEYIKVSDAVVVTHERLFHDVFPINQNVYILPNAIPDWGQFKANKTPSDLIRLFWAGGVTHKNDIQILSGPVRRFNFPNIQMVMGGYVKESPEYRAMASAFTNGGRIRHNLIEALPVDSYYYMYSECDIALIPLTETKFNSYKSNLKILEAANVGAPVVVSRVHPYLDFDEDLVNYIDKQGDWYKQVKMLVDNPGYAKQQGQYLKEYCREYYNFEKINKQRKELFENVAAKPREAREIPFRA